MERPYILHMFTPGKQMSPFDVNMAADAGYQLVVPYTEVALDQVAALTQDTIFSRGPKGVARTGIFIGGRDALLAADMLERARASMVPPFTVSLLADPSGAYTTAAAMVACVEAALQQRGARLAGRRVLVLGGMGPVGRIAGVLAAQAGAEVLLSSRGGQAHAEQGAAQTGQRFGVSLHGISGANRADLRASLADAEVLLACAAAGVRVVDADDLALAPRLAVAADLNAVPPSGIEGLDVMDHGRALAGSGAVGIGALAIGDIKYQTQNRLLNTMRESPRALVLDFSHAHATSQAVLAERAAAAGD